MTREEAQNLLNNSRPKGNNAYSIMLNEAFNMAIKALEQEPCDNAVSRRDVLDLAKKGVLVSNGNYESVCKAINELPSVNPQPCEDAISRQEALGCCRNEWEEEVELRLKSLPSVNPQPCDDAISREDALNCATLITSIPTEDWDIGDWVCLFRDRVSQLPSVNPQPCDDAISRQAVIDGINRYFHDDYYQRTSIQDCRDCLIEDVINELPPVTPQPKTGHWIDDNENEIDAQYGRHLYKCSECNEYADMFIGGTEDWWDLEKPNYCPNCGCTIVEPQERSDKE